MVAVRATRNWLNPFSFVLCLFALAGWFQIFTPIWVYQGYLEGISLQAAFYIVLISIGLFHCTVFLRPMEPTRDVFRIVPNLPKSAVLWGCFIANILITLMIFRKNEWIPPLMLIGSNWGTVLHSKYADHDIAFFTPLSFGLGRFIWIYLFWECLVQRRKIVDHFKENKLYYLMALVCCLTGVLSARRNVVFWPICWLALAYMITNKITFREFRKGVFYLAVFTLVFTGLGNYRRGSVFDAGNRAFLQGAHRFGLPVIVDVYGQVALYTTPIYANLTAMIEFPPQLSHGKIILSEMVPDKILATVMTSPEHNAIGYLSSTGVLPMRGQTFRSIFTDLYADFGYFGSLLAGVVIFGLMVYMYPRLLKSPYVLFIFMVFLPGLMFFTFLNGFTKIVTMISFLIFVISFRVEKILPHEFRMANRNNIAHSVVGVTRINRRKKLQNRGLES